MISCKLVYPFVCPQDFTIQKTGAKYIMANIFHSSLISSSFQVAYVEPHMIDVLTVNFLISFEYFYHV